MTFKKIIETAIERGFKANPTEYIIIDVEGRQVNLEDIETLKELCRVLWGEEAQVDEFGEFDLAMPMYYCHLFRLVNLSSWTDRKSYIEGNFNGKKQ